MNGLDIDDTLNGAIGAFADQGRIDGLAVTILTVSFLASTLLEWRKLLSGHAADWTGPVMRLCGYGVLLAFYSLFARSLVETVASLGDLQSVDSMGAQQTVFAKRAETFAEGMAITAQQSTSGFGLSLHLLMNGALEVTTYLTFTFAAACVFILKVIQKVMLGVLLTVGPLMIAFSSIPGMLSQLLSSWVMGVVEVSAWGITAKLFLSMLVASEKATTLNPNVTQNLAEHVVFNLTYGAAFLIIPVATATILRGGASSLGQAAVQSAKGAALGFTAAAYAAWTRPGSGALGAPSSQRGPGPGGAATNLGAGSGPSTGAASEGASATAQRAGDRAGGVAFFGDTQPGGRTGDRSAQHRDIGAAWTEASPSARDAQKGAARADRRSFFAKKGAIEKHAKHARQQRGRD